MAFEAEDIRDWRGQAVVDSDGAKIGTLEAVHFDTASQLAVFASGKVGSGATRLTFVLLDNATVALNHVRVRADKKLVKDAPSGLAQP